MTKQQDISRRLASAQEDAWVAKRWGKNREYRAFFWGWMAACVVIIISMFVSGGFVC